MKPSIFIRQITSLSLTAVLILSSTSCKKFKAPECEKWEVVIERANIGGCSDWSCAGSRTLQQQYCGDALKDAKAGNSIILSEDGCCKKTLTYVRFIE